MNKKIEALCNTEKRYHFIGEIAKSFDVSASTIRFWETQFGIIAPRKTKNNVRQYTKKDIKNIAVVYHLIKEKGFTIEGAKENLKNKPKISENIQAMESLKKVRSFLVDLKGKIE